MGFGSPTTPSVFKTGRLVTSLRYKYNRWPLAMVNRTQTEGAE